MIPVKLPHFLFEGSLQGVFESVEELQDSLEPPDVEHELFEVFDAVGRRFDPRRL